VADLPDALTHELGPLPVGVWIGAGVLGLGIAWYMRKHPSTPAADPTLTDPIGDGSNQADTSTADPSAIVPVPVPAVVPAVNKGIPRGNTDPAVPNHLARKAPTPHPVASHPAPRTVLPATATATAHPAGHPVPVVKHHPAPKVAHTAHPSRPHTVTPPAHRAPKVAAPHVVAPIVTAPHVIPHGAQL
jgi:hypothetical protein